MAHMMNTKYFFNAPTVVIGPHITSVSLADILDEPPPDEYMETDEFRKLILVWKERNFNH